MERFNPHLTGYGLEESYICWRTIINSLVSILILLDTGWKCGNFGKFLFAGTVSILILLDTGWKQKVLYEGVLYAGFNPHLTGYGLEESGQYSQVNPVNCFNPHLTGYGLEVIDIVDQGKEPFVSILILLDTGWK